MIKKRKSHFWTWLGITLGVPLGMKAIIETQMPEDDDELNNAVITALFQEENISILEDLIIREGSDYFHLIMERDENRRNEKSAGNDYDSMIEYYNQTMKPEQEEFLGIDTFENPEIYTGFWGQLVSPFTLFTSACGLGIGALFFKLKKEYSLAREEKGFQSGVMGPGLQAAGICFLLTPSILLAMGGCFYDPISDSIVINDSSCETIEKQSIPLVHEITHYLQDLYRTANSTYLQEGHARGVELQIAQEMYERTGNPDYLINSLSLELGDMLAAYYSLCAWFEVEPIVFADLEANEVLEAHGIGTSLFQIREERWRKQSQEMYQRVLQGDYCMILNSPNENGCE